MQNYFHIIGAHDTTTSSWGASLSGPPDNCCYIFVHTIEDEFSDSGVQIIANRNVTAHGFTHQFDKHPIPGYVTWPGEENPHHHIGAEIQFAHVPPANHGCLLNHPNDPDESSSWCIYHVYAVRDQIDPTEK